MIIIMFHKDQKSLVGLHHLINDPRDNPLRHLGMPHRECCSINDSETASSPVSQLQHITWQADDIISRQADPPLLSLLRLLRQKVNVYSQHTQACVFLTLTRHQLP